ncbi:hypothetical protein C0995_006720 [Termitomyces sp. Mi166|nr:hypothetical protein C0995_006720 [Termitomyces sp. Mi166\
MTSLVSANPLIMIIMISDYASTKSEYDGYFSEIDEEVEKACVAAELKCSPVKQNKPLLSSLSMCNPQASVSVPNRPKTNVGSSFSSFKPKTPSKKRGPEPDTPASRAVSRAFDSLALASPGVSITPKKRFLQTMASPSKNKGTRHVIAVGDSDTEEALTDTESASSNDPSPPTAQDSLSSIGSDWDKIESFSSFKSPTAGGSGGSPSKYRKLSEEVALPSKNSSSSSTKPIAVQDIFGTNLSSSSPSQRSNGWDTSITQPFLQKTTPPDDDAALRNFLDHPLGQELEPHIIAHDKDIVVFMENHKISWGTQYELARGVTEGNWTWADVKVKIPQLCGSNSEIAWKVRNIMLNRTQPPSAFDHSIWEELDREQDAIMENKGRGLGPKGPQGVGNDWYGGQIQQTAKLVGNKGEYRIRLEPMENKRSYRLARFLGSRRILQLKIPRDLIFEENKQLRQFMRHKFVLCGRVFVPFFAKDHAVYLVETDEDYERCGAHWAGDQFRWPFEHIINWHNPLQFNAKQPINKYATRFALAFSTSIPVLEFKEENIFLILDLTDTWRELSKAPAEYIKTDGCGFINEAALKIIARVLNYFGYPVAVQGRVYGAKGLWILHPTDTSSEPKIWIRSSQQKIVYKSPVHRSHLIFDLCSVSSSASSASLSKQSIMNLSKNGVSDATLIEIMKKALIEEVRPLMQWQGPQAMEVLWSVINRLSSVSRTRLTRLSASLSRALGLRGQDWRAEEIDVERNEDAAPAEGEGPADIYTGRASSGVPLSLAEYIMESLQAGFHPKDSTLLKDKIRNLVQTTIKSIVDKFSIPLPESLSAFIIPDPRGVLEEGEVYYRSSVPLINSETQDRFSVLTGNVLVMAVDRPELSRWVDVLIVSTKGEKSFASMLSGGEHFKNKPVKPIPPHFMDDNFQKHPKGVIEFTKRVFAMSHKDAAEAFADILMFDLDDTKFGLYSNWQDYAIWKYGYEDPRSERLAYIFNALLDSSKTGDRLKPGIFERDQKEFGKIIPDFQSSRASDKSYIFHTLQLAGKAAGDELLRDYDELKRATRDVEDKILLRPYNSAADRANELYRQSSIPGHSTLCDELKRIRECVDEARVEHIKVLGKLVAESESPTKKKPKKTQQRKPDPMARVYELYDRQVKDIVFFQNVDEIKASYAYQCNSRFGFEVAFRELCVMKAKASSDGIAPTVRSFDEAKVIPSNYIRVVARLSASDS